MNYKYIIFPLSGSIPFETGNVYEALKKSNETLLPILITDEHYNIVDTYFIRRYQRVTGGKRIE